jgi:hypothetical protein
VNDFLRFGRHKSDMGDDEKAMFKRVIWPCELIFSLIAGTICVFGEIEKAMFQASLGTANTFSAFWTAQNATSFRSRKLKIDFLPCGWQQNATWARSRKRCFKA